MTLHITLRIIGEISIHNVPYLELSDQKIASLSTRIIPLSALHEADNFHDRNWLGNQLENPDESKGELFDSVIKDIEEVAALLTGHHVNTIAMFYEANSFVLMLAPP